MKNQGIPSELRSKRAWCVISKHNKAPKKLSGYGMSVNNRGEYLSYANAKDAVASGKFVDIGFILTKDDGYAVIDIDHLQEALNVPEIAALLKLDTYIETSQSGNGKHIWVKYRGCRSLKTHYIEIYTHKRMIITTGNGNNKNIKAVRIDYLWDLFAPETTTTTQNNRSLLRQSDEGVILDAQMAKNSNKFEMLFAGCWEGMGYPSQSEADYALIAILAYYTKDREQIKRIFLSSSLGARDKAQNTDYVDRMIGKLL